MACLALLTIQREYADFDATIRVRTEKEAVALISVHHVSKLRREDVVTAVFTLLLASDWISVLDR